LRSRAEMSVRVADSIAISEPEPQFVAADQTGGGPKLWLDAYASGEDNSRGAGSVQSQGCYNGRRLDCQTLLRAGEVGRSLICQMNPQNIGTV
jgi:hypothetical protein